MKSEAEKRAVEKLKSPLPGFGAFHAATAEAEKARVIAEAEVGDVMPDGTIYAGISPDTRKPMYAAPAGAPRTGDFNEVARYARRLKVGGKKSFRVPTKAELNVLFENREKGALKGTFNLASSPEGDWYWSSTPKLGYNVYVQSFNGGQQVMRYYFAVPPAAAIRCVRN